MQRTIKCLEGISSRFFIHRIVTCVKLPKRTVLRQTFTNATRITLDRFLGWKTKSLLKGSNTKGGRFDKFIGDGDSSTYKKLRDLRLYKNPTVYIEKFECLNHLHKNFGKKFIALLNSKKFNPAARNLLTRKIGGKRVFNALARSYKGRTAQAAVQYNSEGHSISSFQKFKYDNPQRACLKLEGSRNRKNLQNSIREEHKPKKQKNDERCGNNNIKKIQYGEGHEDLDLTPSEMETAKTNFLQQLDEDRQNRYSIQIQTKGQRFNTRWSEIRQNLLTSSYFGRILNVRNWKSYTSIVDEILYHNNQYSNASDIVHEHLHEMNALKIFRDTYKNELIDTYGIFIDAEQTS